MKTKTATSLNNIILDQLKDEELKLRNKLNENCEQQRKINRQKFMEQYGISFGDKVSCIDGSPPPLGRGKEVFGFVKSFTYSGNDIDHLWLVVENRDGDPGKRITRVWNRMLETMKKI